jgi:hypothetical protein
MKTNIKILRGDYSKNYCSLPSKFAEIGIKIRGLWKKRIKKHA